MFALKKSQLTSFVTLLNITLLTYIVVGTNHFFYYLTEHLRYDSASLNEKDNFKIAFL